MALEREMATYRARLAELVNQHGRFVLIHGEDVVDHFGSYVDALRDGYRRFGLQPFLVKQILVPEPIHTVPQFRLIERIRMDTAGTARENSVDSADSV